MTNTDAASANHPHPFSIAPAISIVNGIEDSAIVSTRERGTTLMEIAVLGGIMLAERP